MSKEKETIINGIDVSEEIRYCNNCSNLGLDFKIGKFYCSLSNRKDELPEILSCKNFSSNCYIKRLQEENEELKICFTSTDINAKKIQTKLFDKEEECEKYKQTLEEIREILMCKIYGLNENASQLDYMCYVLDKFEKIRIKILTKINEVLKQ